MSLSSQNVIEYCVHCDLCDAETDFYRDGDTARAAARAAGWRCVALPGRLSKDFCPHCRAQIAMNDSKDDHITGSVAEPSKE